MPGIGVVFNPRSGRNLRDPGAALRLARQLGDHGVVRPVRSFEELQRTAEDFKRLDIDVLGISGGDGTNHVTITGFLEVYAPNIALHDAPASPLPQLAFLRGGTMNTVADSVGVQRGRPEGLLGRLIRAYVERATRPLANVERRVMRVQPTGSTPARAHYGFLFGTGAVYGFLAEYYRNGEPSPLVAAKTLARGIGSTLVGGATIRRMAQPFRGSVTFADGSAWPERDYFSIAAATIDQIGLGFRPFHRANQLDGAFHLLGIYATPFQFLRELPRIQRALPMRPGRTYEATPARATIRSTDDTMRYTLDGDLQEHPGALEISTGPKVKIVLVR